MPKLTGTFSADGQESLEVAVPAGGSYYIVLTPSPSLTGSIALLSRTDTVAAFDTVATFTAANTGTEYVNQSTETIYLRLRCVDLDAGTETVAYTLQSLISTGMRYIVDHRPKVGATSGWVINAANNIGTMATLPAGQTNSTIVVPVNNIQIGDHITGFYPTGQVESAGNTATITCELRKLTSAAADLVDATVATTGAISFTADAVLGRITAPRDGIHIEVADGQTYYFLITGTTAASTDIALQGVAVQVERNGH